MEQQIEELRKEFEREKKLREEQQVKLNFVFDCNQFLKKDNEELQEQIKQINQKLNDKIEQNRKQVIQKGLLQQENDEGLQQIRDLDLQFQNQQMNAQFKEEIEKYNQKTKSLEEQKVAIEKKLNNQTNQFDMLQLDVQDLQEQVRYLEIEQIAQGQKSQEENNQMQYQRKQQLKQQQQQQQQWEQKYQQKEEERKKFQRENAILKNKVADLEKKLGQVQQVKQKEKQKLQQFDENLEELEYLRGHNNTLVQILGSTQKVLYTENAKCFHLINSQCLNNSNSSLEDILDKVIQYKYPCEKCFHWS